MKIPVLSLLNHKSGGTTSALYSIRARLLLGFMALVLLPATTIAVASAILYWRNSVGQVLQTASPLTNREEHVINHGGNPRWYLTTSVPLRDHTGTITGLLGISRDITERKQTEETLRESEQRYRSLFQELPIPLWEEDMSACKAIIEGLRDQGVDDLDDYFDQHLETLRDIADGIRFIGANRAALAFYLTSDPAEFWPLWIRNGRKPNFRNSNWRFWRWRTASSHLSVRLGNRGYLPTRKNGLHYILRFHPSTVIRGHEPTCPLLI